MPPIAPRPPDDALGALAIRSSAALILAAHRQLLAAPCLERARQYGRRSRRPNEQKLLKLRALDRANPADEHEQERNWKQSGHVKPTLAMRAVSNARLQGNVGRVGSVPAGERAGVEKDLLDPTR